MERREYAVSLVVNGIWIRRIVIDPHYEIKHAKSITDALVIELVKALHGEWFEIENRAPPYGYFMRDNLELNGRFHKLIWLLEDNENYIGVVNAYRR